MVIVTGGAGFIGSALIAHLNSIGQSNILVVDHLGRSEKWKNLTNKSFVDYLSKEAFKAAIESGKGFGAIEGIFHLGACSSTTETDADYIMENNFHYTRLLAEWALKQGIRFIYASSAATYGDGEQGFSDDEELIPSLRPLNMYGYSKQLFDLWVLRNKLSHIVVGLKFFNVFGPNEYHKGEMRSVVHKAVGQIRETGGLRLFKSDSPSYKDGDSVRDFVYVKDCCSAMLWLYENKNVNGIFNLGTGKARSWNDLGKAVFKAMGLPVNIEYIDLPANLKGKYQYFTEAKMSKLQATGCPIPNTSLEDSIDDYVKHYILQGDKVY